jgi:protein TonB
MDPNQRNLTLAVGISLLLHGLALSIHFTYPDAFAQVKEQALDVILVNSKHSRRPKDAQAKAQTNLDGGGNTAENRRATTPLPPSDKVREGDDLVEAQQRVAQLEAAQRQMLTQIKSMRTLPLEAKQQEPLPTPTPAMSGYDLANRALAIARLEAQIERQTDQYNKLPRKKFVGVRTEEYLPAQYIEDWRQKVERVGNLNYPEAARGKLYGSLVVYVEIDSAGELVRSEVQRPSGHKLLDEAALRIVRLAATNGFGRFSAEMKREFDILAFARTLNFVQSDQLQTK